MLKAGDEYQIAFLGETPEVRPLGNNSFRILLAAYLST
jgi:hypothetical protein